MIKDNFISDSKFTKLPPFHLFQRRDFYFLFDIKTSCFYKIEKLAYDFLKLSLKMEPQKAKQIFFKKNNLPENEKSSISESIDTLIKNGLFDSPDIKWDDKSFKKKIQSFNNKTITGLELMLAETCNLSCVYCFCKNQTNHSKSLKLMSKDTIKQALDFLFAHTTGIKKVQVNFFGGEPLLNLSGLEFALVYGTSLSKKNKIQIIWSMTTNATLITPKVIKLLEKYRIKLMVSLDGPRKIHNAQCPTKDGKGSYDIVEKKIRLLLNYKIPVSIHCTLTHPLKKLKPILHFFENFDSKKFEHVVIEPSINPSGKYTTYDLTEFDYQELKRQEQKILPLFLARNSKYKYKYFYDYDKLIKRILQKPTKPFFDSVRCGVIPQSLNVGVNGDIFPCNRFSSMDNWKVGNIFTGIDITFYHKFWVKNREILKKVCSKCWACNICRGPCPSEMSTSTGEFISPKRCQYLKDHIENTAFYLMMRE